MGADAMGAVSPADVTAARQAFSRMTEDMPELLRELQAAGDWLDAVDDGPVLTGTERTIPA